MSPEVPDTLGFKKEFLGIKVLGKRTAIIESIAYKGMGHPLYFSKIVEEQCHCVLMTVPLPVVRVVLGKIVIAKPH